MHRLIKSSDYQVMPWKNGLGVTSEIAIEPPTARFPQDDFLWRLSSARVAADNEFSKFPGCDRWLAVWKGSGLWLNGRKLEPLQPLRFSGEDGISCQVASDEVIDVGLIFQRDRIEASMELVSLTKPMEFSAKAGWTALFCARGSLQVKGTAVSEGETLLIDGEQKLQLIPLGSVTLLQLLIRSTQGSS